MKCKFSVGPSALLALAVLILLSGFRAALEVAAAMLIHELGHLAAMKLLGVQPDTIVLTAAGARIDYGGLLPYGTEILIAGAGPLASLLTALLAARIGGPALHIFAGLNLLYCLLNLTPAGVTDGGRILDAALSAALGPQRAWKLLRALDLFCVFCLFLAGFYIFAETRGNCTLILCAVFLLNSGCKRCKSSVKSIP